MLDCVVIGGDSPIGSALVARLRAAGRDVAWTTRRRDGGSEALHLDLADPSCASQLPATRSVAIVAAETRFAACAEHPERSRLVNVLGPAALARRAFKTGGRVLFFSSISVHDGAVDAPDEDVPPRPNSIYGAQKLEAEGALARLAARWRGELALVRPSKVVVPGFPLFAHWRDALARGERIEPFRDMRIAPVWLDRVIDVASALVSPGAPTGVFQISARDEVTYADLACRLAERLGAPSGLVSPCVAADRLDPATLWLPDYARLGAARLGEIGLDAPPSWDALERFLAERADAMR